MSAPRDRAVAPGVFSRLARSPAGLAGLALSGIVLALGLFGGLLAPADPFLPTGAPLRPPGPGHPLGTDDLGRDVLSGVLHGARISLLVGLITAATAAVIGTAIGATAGFYGRGTDDLLMRITEFVQVIPRFFLAVLVAALFGPSIVFLVILFGLTFWPGTARLVRSQVLSIREREYIVAARAIGLRNARILGRHVLPNVLAIVLVSGALQVGAAILIEASLSFLGLGDRTVVSWGYMLNNAQPFLRSAPWLSVFPGIALVATVLGTNLLADGLQSAWERPRT